MRRSEQPRASEQDSYRTIARSRVAPSRKSQPTPGYTASIEFVKILCFRYTFAMTEFENIYEIATDNHGLTTPARAREVEISSNELVRYAKRGRIAKVGHGLYQLEQWCPGRTMRTPGQSCPSGPTPCSTANPSSPYPILLPQTRLARSWQHCGAHGARARPNQRAQ